MAKTRTDVAAQSRTIIEDARKGIFSPLYLLMGDEPYYPDLVCQAIIDNCVDEFGKDFNEQICYGLDVTPEQVITAAREFPMMSDRRLIVVRDAQLMTGIEKLDVYCSNPLDTTVLVLLFRKAGLDRRKSLYKTLSKNAVVLDSPCLRDYEVAGWVSSFFASKGLNIDGNAAALMAESTGTDLGTIVAETDKICRNLPQGTRSVSVADVEKNVGVSKRFSVFELNKALSLHDAQSALRIAAYLGDSAKFAMPQAVSALFLQFNRILKYGALLSSVQRPSAEDKARALAGVPPFLYREYDTALRYYPPAKAAAVISLLCRYDYLGKGGDGGQATPGELLMELVAKILNI